MKSWLHDNGIEMYLTHDEEKSFAAERFSRAVISKIYKTMAVVSKIVYIDKLDEVVGKYNINSRRGVAFKFLNCFFLSFSNHENCSIKNICVYSKSKIKTKVTSKQNLEHFKMINRRLFIHKFCNNCPHPG